MLSVFKQVQALSTTGRTQLKQPEHAQHCLNQFWEGLGRCKPPNVLHIGLCNIGRHPRSACAMAYFR
eukprot:4793723-Alexandrium_andersonii.AAC.1